MTNLATTVIPGGIIVLNVNLLLQAIGAPVAGGGDGLAPESTLGYCLEYAEGRL